ncbi:Hypothetical predicted protein, partial [Olea europaea subsp. europaea]
KTKQDKVTIDSQHKPLDKKAVWTSNPYDFYTIWVWNMMGHEERRNNIDAPKNLKQECEMIHPTFSQINNEEFEIEYEVEDEEVGESWRKRA